MNKEHLSFFAPVIIVAVVGLLVLSQFPDSPSGEVSIGRVMPKPGTPGIKPGDKVGVGVSPGGPVGEKVGDIPPIKVGVDDKIGDNFKPGREMIPEKVEAPKKGGKYKIPPWLEGGGRKKLPGEDKPKEGIPGEGGGAGGGGGPFVDEEIKGGKCKCNTYIKTGYLRRVINPSTILRDKEPEEKDDSQMHDPEHVRLVTKGRVDIKKPGENFVWIPFDEQTFRIEYPKELKKANPAWGTYYDSIEYKVILLKYPLSFTLKKQPPKCSKSVCQTECRKDAIKLPVDYIFDGLSREAKKIAEDVYPPEKLKPASSKQGEDVVAENVEVIKNKPFIDGDCFVPTSSGK